jgi:rubrerythrin
MLREDLTAELQAINQYHGHMLILNHDEATTTLECIAEGKKEHVAELLRLIQSLDVVQAEKFREIL